jgi:hypothetical protein
MSLFATTSPPQRRPPSPLLVRATQRLSRSGPTTTTPAAAAGPPSPAVARALADWRAGRRVIVVDAPADAAAVVRELATAFDTYTPVRVRGAPPTITLELDDGARVLVRSPVPIVVSPPPTPL